MTAQLPPNVLYHYTTQEALLGILEGHQGTLDEKPVVVLWATKIQYMNDASELVAPLGIADDILRLKESECSADDKTRANIVHQMRWAVENSPNVNIGVVAFSAHKDRLSQWRAYGRTGPGYAIGFDSAKLVPPAGALRKLKLVACEYLEENERRSRINQLVAECIDSGSPSDFIFRLLMMASTTKDVSFQEEGEWRIVPDVCSSEDLGNYWTCHFRTGKSMIVPYWRLPLDPAAIKEVWIGPTPHPQLAKEAVKGLLYRSQLGLGDQVKVINSRIPYRNW